LRREKRAREESIVANAAEPGWVEETRHARTRFPSRMYPKLPRCWWNRKQALGLFLFERAWAIVPGETA